MYCVWDLSSLDSFWPMCHFVELVCCLYLNHPDNVVNFKKCVGEAGVDHSICVGEK